MDSMKMRMQPIVLAIAVLGLGIGAWLLIGSEPDSTTTDASCEESYLESTGGEWSHLVETVSEGVFDSCESYDEFSRAAKQGPHDIDPFVGIEDVGLALASTICTQARVDRRDHPICKGYWDLPDGPSKLDIEIYWAMEMGLEPEDVELEEAVNQVGNEFSLSADEVVDAWVGVQDWVFEPISRAEMDNSAFPREPRPRGAIDPAELSLEGLCGFSASLVESVDLQYEVWVFESTVDAQDYIGREIKLPDSSLVGEFDNICVSEGSSGYSTGFSGGLEYRVSSPPRTQDYSSSINEDPPHYPGTTEDIITFEMVDINGLEGLGANAVPGAPPSQYNTETPSSLRWRDDETEYNLVASDNTVLLETLVEIAKSVR